MKDNVFHSFCRKSQSSQLKASPPLSQRGGAGVGFHSQKIPENPSPPSCGDDIHQQFVAILMLIEYTYRFFLHFSISARNYDSDLFTKKCSGVSWRYTSSIY